MRGNLLVLLGFSIVLILGFILDVLRGTGGSDKMFTIILYVALIATALLISNSSFTILHNKLQSFNNIILYIFTFGFVIIQIVVAFILTSLINLYIISPIMIKLGFQVTMP